MAQTLEAVELEPPIEYSGIYGVCPKAPDVEVHVRIARCDGEVWVDSRDFIRSSGTYGRGIKVPLDEAMDYGMYVMIAAAGELGIDLP